MTRPATQTVPITPAVGERAPEFSLPAHDRRTVTLADSRGREPVLLAFFPLAFTSTCTAEMCAFRDDFDAYQARGVRVLPISVDSTATLAEYRKQLGIAVDMLSDFHRDVSRAYGVLLPEFNYANRAYFLIDRDGIVRWCHVEDTPGQTRDTAELLAAVDALA